MELLPFALTGETAHMAGLAPPPEAWAATQHLLDFPYSSLDQYLTANPAEQVTMKEAGLGYKNAKRGKKIPLAIRRKAV